MRTILLSALAGAVMFFAGRACGRRADNAAMCPMTRIDTVVVRDTLRDTVLVPVKRFIVRVDTVMLPAVRDTATVEAIVPIERTVYATDDYRAVVEGFRPELVELELYRQTSLVTHETTMTPAPKKWGFGLQIGYGFGPRGARPYIGVGIQYRLKEW